jgi:hypothetical protein
MTNLVRPDNDAYAGQHRHSKDKGKTFEVYYKGRAIKRAWERAGWYWRVVPFDELTGEESGPFTSSRLAYRDAYSSNVEN